MTRKEIDRATPTHSLETVEGRTCQDTEGNRPSDAHSPTGDGRRKDLSGHGKKGPKRRALTYWRCQREGLVRACKATDRATRTHSLETAEGRTCQNTERNRPRDAHSHPGDGRGTDLSGHGKERVRETPTRILETAEGGTYQDSESDRPSDAHSRTGNGRGRDLSGHGKQSTK